MRKRVVAAFLSVVMLAAIPAQAAELTTPGGTASSDVTFTVGDTAPKVFSVTVPAEIPMNMDLNGNLTVAANLSIGNASSEAVKVTAISVDGKNGWSIEDWTTDLSSEPDNTAKLALEFRGDGTTAGGAISLSDGNWEIDTASSLPLNAKAKMPRWTQESSKASIAQVNWTIDWADGSVTPPPDIGHTITIGTGEHGKVNDSSDLTTNAAGKITSFPSTTPDTGYIFDHWEDESGNVVDVDTVFDGNTVIKPVFIVDPDYNPSNGSTITDSEASALGFTFANYQSGVQITKFENKQFKAEINVPEQIGDFKVLSLGPGVFTGQTNLTKITLPDSIASVSSSEFKGCTGLTSVKLGDGLTTLPSETFSGCSALANVELPSGLVEIGANTFKGCSSLRNLGSLAGVEIIGNNAFDGCGLRDIVVPESVTQLGTGTFQGCTGLVSAKVEGTIQTLPNYTFSGCIALERVELSESVQALGEWCLQGTKALSSISLPVGLKTIGVSAFQNSGVPRVDIPNSVTTIGNKAFYGVAAVTVGAYVSKDIPEPLPQYITRCDFGGVGSLTVRAEAGRIGDWALKSRSGGDIGAVVVEEGVTQIGTGAFSGCSASKIQLPSTVSSLGIGAFSDCASLTEINIPRVSALPSDLMTRCKSLKTVEIPEGVEVIGERAFSSCGLESVNLPGSLREIKRMGFHNNPALANVEIPHGTAVVGEMAFNLAAGPVAVPDSVTSIGSDAFYNVSVYYSGGASGSPWGAKQILPYSQWTSK